MSLKRHWRGWNWLLRCRIDNHELRQRSSICKDTYGVIFCNKCSRRLYNAIYFHGFYKSWQTSIFFFHVPTWLPQTASLNTLRSNGMSPPNYHRMITQDLKRTWRQLPSSWDRPTWCSDRVLPQKLTHPLLLKKFPTFYGTRRFITASKKHRHVSLSSARSIQSMPSHQTSLGSILILSSHLRLGLPSGPLKSGFPTKPYMHLSSPPYVLHVLLISVFLT